MGHVPSASSGLPTSAALAALRSAPPPLALSAVLAAAVVLQRHYLTPHDTHTPPPQVLAPADAGPVLPLGGSDDAEDTELARMLIQRQPGSDLLVFATMVAAQTDATEAALAAANGQQPDVWLDAEVMALIQGLAGQAAASRRAVRRASSYRWDGQQLLRCLPDGRARVCPPPAERLGIADRLHLSLGHLGVRRTRALLQLGYWWFDMGATAAHVVRNCRACDLSRVTGDARPAELQPLPVRGLFYRWGVDLAGELTPTEPDGYRYCVIAIEHFSKHIEVVPIVDKTADRVARVFADIMARFGAPAEVVTDNGSEFEGEFAALLERCYVDHRHASPGHPQADGAAERIVRVVKDALRKACYESADPARWDRALPHLLLGYRCSPQAATQYSPFRLLHGGVEPQVPAAVREGFAEPLSFEDAAAATESLRARAAWVQRHYPEAAGNLLVAQHRDTRRYAAARAARRLTNTPEFSAGDYVYIKKLKVDNTLQFQYYDTILRVKSVGPLGVAVLIGRDGTQQLRRRVEQLAPCHLDVDPAIEPQLFRPGKDLACEACSSPGQPARMLLCDGCNQGWHTNCLRPPLREVPTGAWLCPRCLAHLSQQPPTEEATREWPEQLGQLLFPKASTRRLDDEARQMDGTVVTRRVRTGRGKGAGETEQKALLQFRGALYRPHYFAVKWPGEVEMEYWTLEHVRRGRARA